MPGIRVCFKIDGPHVFGIGALRFAVYRAFVEPRVLAGSSVDRVDVDNRHLLVQHFRLGLYQLA